VRLSTIRDTAIAAGGLAAIAMALDDIVGVPFQRRTPVRTLTPSAYGHLFRMGTTIGDESRGSYVRPATADEAKASARAAELDGGPGVFGVLDEDGQVRHLLPDDPAWGAGVISRYNQGPQFFRVVV
jgi:hypothetical protein